MRRLLPLLLFLSVAYPQKQYNIEGIIERDSLYYKKFSDEIVNGSVYQMFDDMKISLGKMKEGKKYGKWNEWYNNGNKKTEGNYKDAIKDGLWIYWYENGQMKERYMFNYGVKADEGERWTEKGYKLIELYGVSEGTILIGNIQDLSGPMKELGAVIPSGAHLYFQHINDQGGVHGRKIKMLIEDHQYNPQKAVVAANKLIAIDSVFCLFQVIGTATCEAIRPVLAKYNIPLIAPATSSGTMSDLSREAGGLIFHTDTGYDRQAEILVDYILNQNSNAKIGLVYQDDVYGENVLEGIASAESEHKITVQKESYQRGAIDFKGQTMNLLKSGCTDVIIAGIVREPVTVMKTAEAMNYNPNFYGTSPTMDPRVGRIAGSSGEGFTAVYSSHMWNSDKPGAKLYLELCEKYNIPEPFIGLYHFYGFMSAQVLVEGLKKAGEKPTPEKLVQAMESIKDWDNGSHLPITFGQNDHAGVENAILYKWENGKHSPIN